MDIIQNQVSTRLFKGVLFISIVSVAACDRVPMSRQVDSVQSVNVLSLASVGMQVDKPWLAQDQDVLEIAKLEKSGTESALALGIVTTVETPCSGGGLRIRTTDNVDPPWFSQGDTYTTEFINCITGNTETNGARIFSIDVLTGTPFVDPTWTSSMTMARQNFTRTNLNNNTVSAADGTSTTSMSVTNNTDFSQTTSGNWSRTRPNNGTEVSSSAVYDVTSTWVDDPTGLGAYTWAFDVAVDSSLFGSTSAQSLETLTGIGTQPPDTGKFVMTKGQPGGVNQITTYTATGAGSVLVELDSDGDGVIDSTSTTTWDQLMLEPLLFQFF